MTKTTNTTVTKEQRDEIIREYKIAEAGRKALDAYCMIHEVWKLMEEAGCSEEGIAQVKRAAFEMSGWQPEHFLPDREVNSWDRGAYFDLRYVENDDVPLSGLESAGWLDDHFRHRQFKKLEIVAVDDKDDETNRRLNLRWTFHNDDRFGYLGDKNSARTIRDKQNEITLARILDSNGNDGAQSAQADIDDRERNS